VILPRLKCDNVPGSDCPGKAEECEKVNKKERQDPKNASWNKNPVTQDKQHGTQHGNKQTNKPEIGRCVNNNKTITNIGMLSITREQRTF
jgi:hypothetical protein